MYSASYSNTNHDVKTFDIAGKVKNIKNWISQ